MMFHAAYTQAQELVDSGYTVVPVIVGQDGRKRYALPNKAYHRVNSLERLEVVWQRAETVRLFPGQELRPGIYLTGSDVLVIDVDNHGPGFPGMNHLIGSADKPEMVMYQETPTNHGLHVFCRQDGTRARSGKAHDANGTIPSIDIKVSGFVAVYPSLKPVPVAELPPAPNWVYLGPVTTAGRPPALNPRIPFTRCRATSGPPIVEGSRNETLSREIQIPMRRQGTREGDVLDVLREANVKRCRPPLPDAELVDMSRWKPSAAPAATYDPLLIAQWRSKAPTLDLTRSQQKVFASFLNIAESIPRTNDIGVGGRRLAEKANVVQKTASSAMLKLCELKVVDKADAGTRTKAARYKLNPVPTG